ncbi:MAG: hypothetical protein K8F60_02810 [Melioribacteraceae bacterium]|nr:hypothetical protein [Melioribacteraceae bacterium]
MVQENNTELFKGRLNEIITNGDYFKILASAENIASKLSKNGHNKCLTGEDILNELICKVFEGKRTFRTDIPITKWFWQNLLSIVHNLNHTNGGDVKLGSVFKETEDEIAILYPDETSINPLEEIELKEELDLLLSRLDVESGLVLLEKLDNNQLRDIAEKYDMPIKKVYTCNRNIIRKALAMNSLKESDK